MLNQLKYTIKIRRHKDDCEICNKHDIVSVSDDNSVKADLIFGALRDWMEIVDEDNDVVELESVEKININWVLAYNVEKVLIEGFEFIVNDDIAFNIDGIFLLKVVFKDYTVKMEFEGMIDADTGYATCLYIDKGEV